MMIARKSRYSAPIVPKTWIAILRLCLADFTARWMVTSFAEPPMIPCPTVGVRGAKKLERHAVADVENPNYWAGGESRGICGARGSD